MGKTSGASSQVISLPKGGGALHGIGEKFAPDLHTGTGNFTIPIALPSGRNGFQPQLNLVYSTGNGNGPFGLGWSLSIPGVSRKTSKGVPQYDDAQDTFLVSGAEDLVPVPGGPPGVSHYRPRTEGLFARIDHHRSADSDFWQVQSKDGLTSYYGTPRPDHAAADWRNPAAVADPVNTSKIFAWKLTQTRDSFGNLIDYLYERDAVQTDGAHQWDQLYLAQIRYVDYGDHARPNFLITVRFTYADRPDPFSEYRAGFELRTVRRCTQIEVFTHAETDILTRSYHFIYLDQRDLPAAQLPPNALSLLSRIRVVGHDGDAAQELPPLEFGYTRFEPEKRDFFPLQGSDLPARSLANPDLELADLFGNGLPDILEMNGTIRYWRNQGGGQFDLPRPMRDAPAGLTLADPDVQLLDADGDGRIDLLVNANGLSGYFPLQFGGLWDRRSFQRYRLAPSFNLEDPEVKLVDLDGDGVTDAIRSGGRMECFFNDPQEGWSRTRWVERQEVERFPNINFADTRVKWGDMTGDGLQDIAVVSDGNVEYWPNLGYGDWARRVSMRNSPRFPYGYDSRRILVGDVDGDGLADIVYVDDTKVTLWINQSGNRWSDPIVITGTPPVSDIDAIRLVDLLGSGVGGVLWSADAGGLSHASMFFLDFTGGLKPYLMNEMDNHMGAVTRVAYAPSTRFYLEDQQRPATRWKTPLPFPVQVVARVEVIDALSSGKLTTEYRYHHGYWDGAEREFCGFGRVDQRDTETFTDFNGRGLHGDEPFAAVPAQAFSPPTETRTWFYQGPVGPEFGEWEELDFSAEYWPGDPPALSRPASTTNFLKSLPRRVKRDALRTLRGSILRTELYARDGTPRQDRPYTVTESLPGVCEVIDENGRPRLVCASEPALFATASDDSSTLIFFPHTLAQRTTQWERGDEPMSQFSFTADYDAYGQPRSHASIAIPRGRDFRVGAAPGEPYLATQTLTDYAYRDDDQHYIVDRVARATSYEILNDGSTALLALAEEIGRGTATRRLIGQTLNFYDGDAFVGLPWRQIGDHGALVRAESLVLTEELLHDAYRSGGSVLNPAEAPPYLAPDGPSWAAEYPQEFRDLPPPLAGYSYQPGGAGSQYETGYYAVTQQRRYDFQADFQADPAGPRRGLLMATRDPLGHETTIGYILDLLPAFDFLPTTVTDPAGLTTTATYNYRVLQPDEITDPNGSHTAFAFTPLGLLASIAVLDKDGQGDTLEVPGVRMVYDFLAFENSPPHDRQPIFVRTIRREHHIGEIDVELSERDRTIETIEYSDGFGRLLQTRTQAEDAIFGDAVFGGGVLPADQSLPAGAAVGQATVGQQRVVVSGWQTYDNKGRVVEKYEPFFDQGWDYLSRTEAQALLETGVNLFGQKATLFYDPRGQVIRTRNPDGSEQRVIYGVPIDLSDPERFTPTPWRAYTYDANDNAGRTHAATTSDYRHHWNTPAHIVIDGLGRTVEAVARNRAILPDGTLGPIEEIATRSTYDIRGNLLDVTDALRRVAFRYVYDLANRSLRVENIDAGIRRSVLDADGTVVEQRDGKGALILHAYDILNRPIRLWARDDAAGDMTLREWLEYGDGGDPNQPAVERDANQALNRLGRLHQHYDEAGLLTLERYDFKCNIQEKARQVIGDAALLAVFDPPPANWQVPAFRVDWQPSNAAEQLDPIEYRTLLTYDALNRVKMMRYPRDVDGEYRELQSRYNRAGALEHVELDKLPYVERIAYNAKGQRTLIAYGNELMTRYAYDEHTFRLARLRTEHYTNPAEVTYRPNGGLLQDFGYEYDLAGNILATHDRTPNSGLPALPDQLDRVFDYDPLYRLLSATGREHAIQPPDPPWLDTVKSQDMTETRGYSETYTYDSVGNMAQLRHQANGDIFTRVFALATGSNRLDTMSIGATPYAYTYDANGNLVNETTSRHFEWDYADRMRVYRTQTDNAEPSIHAHYLYDAGGQRVKKLVRRQGGGFETTVCIDGIFEHHRWGGNGAAAGEHNRLHVIDDSRSRIALVRVGTPHPADQGLAIQYHLGDHLGSSNVVVDETGTWINREEYTPYGETSFGSFARKRYRFTGKERDEESGLYYYSARYYSLTIGRFISADHITGSLSDPQKLHLYSYVRNNPLIYIDPSGNDGQASQIVTGAREGLADMFPPESIAGVLWPAGFRIYNLTQTAYWTVSKAYATFHKQGRPMLERAIAATGVVANGTNPFAPAVTTAMDTGVAAGLGNVREAARQGVHAVGEGIAIATQLATGLGGSVPSPHVGTSGTTEPSAPPTTTAPLVAPAPVPRLPQDLAVTGRTPRPALPLNRPIGLSPTQNRLVQGDIALARATGGTDIRVNQPQVNAAGEQVGINRPDLQYTLPNGQRIYVEYDTPSSSRGLGHAQRTMANDPQGTVRLRTAP